MSNQYRSAAVILSSLLLPIVVSGCFSSGSDNHQVKYPGNDDGSPGVTPSLSSVKLNFFELKNQDIIQTKSVFRTGSVSEDEELLYSDNSNKDDIPAGTQEYYAGENFFVSFPYDKQPDEWYKTDGTTKVKINWIDDNYQTPYANTRTLEFISINLDGTAGVNATAPIGIYTFLNEIPKTSTQNFAFPKGSRCYVQKDSTEKAFFQFDDLDATDYQTLEQWKNDQNVQAGMGEFVEKQVGTTKQYGAVYLSNSQAEAEGVSYSYAAAVLYDGKVYDAIYHTAGTTQPNTDPKTSLVTCDAYNNVAADFIKNKVKQYYTN